MIVGIDVAAAVGESISGVGYHIVRLLEAMEAAAPANVAFRLFFPAVDSAQRQRARIRLPASSRMRLVPVPFRRTTSHLLHRAFAIGLLPIAARWHGCDLFHGPAHILPRIRRVPTIVTIHDLAFFKYELYEPSLTQALRQVVLESMRSASAIIALSNHTRHDVSEIAGRTSDVHVIYGAGNYATPETGTRAPSDRGELAGLGIGERYVLYVGDFNRRKNLPYLIDAFAKLKRAADMSDVLLVLAGDSREARPELEKHAIDVGLKPADVVFAGRVSDGLLPVLYRNASAFALCSLMEGFTLVTLEAMSYGIPVVATNTSSIAEGTGAAAELVPLDDPEAVARCLRTSITPGRRRDEMIRLGKERISRFDWKSAARQTLALYTHATQQTARHEPRAHPR